MDEATWTTMDDAGALLRAAVEVAVVRQRLVLAACACARVALVHVPPHEPRPRRAVELAEAWARGEATRDALAGGARDADVAIVAARAARGATYATRTAAYTAARAAASVMLSRDGDSAPTVVANAAAAVVYALPLGRTELAEEAHTRLLAAARREARRYMAPLVRAHVPWDAFVQAWLAVRS